jgi:CRP-like cAMP-binding protein
MSRAPERLRALLKSSEPFGALPDAALDQIIGRSRIAQFARDEVIYRRGDPGDSLMVLLSGSVKITNVSASGRELVLGFIQEGALSGEIAAFDGRERTANAVALEPIEALVILRRDLMPVFAAHPQAMLRLVVVITDRLRASNAALEAHGLQMAARTAAGLLRLAAQHGSHTARGICVHLKISQRDLGNYIGLSRERINRILGEFREAGLVRLDRSGIVITNRDELEAVADGL